MYHIFFYILLVIIINIIIHYYVIGILITKPVVSKAKLSLIRHVIKVSIECVEWWHLEDLRCAVVYFMEKTTHSVVRWSTSLHCARLRRRSARDKGACAAAPGSWAETSLVRRRWWVGPVWVAPCLPRRVITRQLLLLLLRRLPINTAVCLVGGGGQLTCVCSSFLCD